MISGSFAGTGPVGVTEADDLGLARGNQHARVTDVDDLALARALASGLRRAERPSTSGNLLGGGFA
jgi:hypothetical protein